MSVAVQRSGGGRGREGGCDPIIPWLIDNYNLLVC